MKFIVKTLVLVGLVAAGTAVNAQTGQQAGTLTNSITIVPACTRAVNGGAASDPTATAFQNASNTFAALPQSTAKLNSAATTATTYAVSCGSGINYQLAFDQGQNPVTPGSTAAAPQRQLTYTVVTGTGPTATTTKNTILYNLFDGTSSNVVGTNTYSGSNQNTYTVTSKITDTAASNTKPAGKYSDVVNVTLTYS